MQIPDDITFDTRDEYLRRPIAEKLIKLLSSDANISPVVIDGSWGTGKTEFCLKLINLINKSIPEYQAVYVDAFANDHADQPLMTLLAAVLKILPESDRATLLQKAIPAVRFGLKTTLKAGVSWLLRQDAADIANDFDDVILKASDEGINLAAASLLQDHVAAEDSISTLRQALEELTAEKPIIIFVDELDRCRPDFAVNLLESIKHVFNVDNVQFVLVTNTEQLQASINHCYGDAIDAKRYLDKFLGFSFVLPQTFKHDGHNHIRVSTTHLDRLISESDLLKKTYLANNALTEFLHQLVATNDLSLREVESFVKYCEIYQAVTDEGGFRTNLIFGCSLLRCFGVFIFCFSPAIAEQFLNDSVDIRKVFAVLGTAELFDLTSGRRPDHADIVAAIVAFETESGRQQFQLADEELGESWAECIESYFRGGGFFRGDPRISIIEATIRELKLSG